MSLAPSDDGENLAATIEMAFHDNNFLKVVAGILEQETKSLISTKCYVELPK